MPKNKICTRCGGSAFVSDRSLGGKIVCLKCGGSSFKNKLNSPVSSKKFIVIFIVVIVLLIIVL